MTRSPPCSIISVGLVFTLAQSLIAAAGKLFDFQVGTELTTLLTVVLFRIGTDYILFLLFRFRERLRADDAQGRGRDRGRAGRPGHRLSRQGGDHRLPAPARLPRVLHPPLVPAWPWPWPSYCWRR